MTNNENKNSLHEEDTMKDDCERIEINVRSKIPKEDQLLRVSNPFLVSFLLS